MARVIQLQSHQGACTPRPQASIWAIDIRPALRLRPEPLRTLRVVADAHPDALAGRLRMPGFDTLRHNDIEDTEPARLGSRKHRILLTRDRRLLMRISVTHGCSVRTTSADAQVAYLVERLQICSERAPFSRCILCNGRVHSAEAETIPDSAPPGIRRRRTDYRQCHACGKVYWKGSHRAAMARRIAEVCSAVRHRLADEQ